MTNPTDSDRATAERIAERIAKALYYVGSPMFAKTIAPFVSAALAAEREACAKVAESTAAEKPAYSTKSGPRPVKVQSMTRIAIAAAIRARSNPNEGK